jgi:preprotein translocase subunit SecB
VLQKLPKNLEKHNITLDDIFVRELHVVRKKPLISKYKLISPLMDIQINARMLKNGKLQSFYRFYTPTNRKKDIIQYDIKFEVYFSIKEGVFERKIAKQFLRSSGFILVWPYFRQILSDNTSRLGLPPLLVPILDVYKTIEKVIAKIK